MKIQLNTNLIPLFSGTYESIWDVREYADNGDELMVEYNHEDLMRSIASVYAENEAYILDELHVPFIKKIVFTGGIHSPREYNFKTDELDFDIVVDKKLLMATLDGLKNDQDFDKYLHDRFTSYDGFMSFTPNNYQDLKTEIVKQGDEFEQAIGALVTYLSEQTDQNAGRESTIEADIYEDWNGNGYGGLDYQIVHGNKGNCPMYPEDKILPNENGDCSLCGGKLDEYYNN